MRRLVQMLHSRAGDDPVAVLFHQLCGHMANWTRPTGGHVAWGAGSHRGIQWLDKVEFPRKQKRYIFSPLFEIRYDTAFEDVVMGCAMNRGEDRSWVNRDLVKGLVRLHEMGFAHSFEAWHDGKLVGGAFGTQLGSMITCDSMFHRMSNASKAAYGQTLLHLHKRGFKVVDTNGVANHMVNYGEEWMPRWQFEHLVYACLKDSPSLIDSRPCPTLPWEIRAILPPLRAARWIAHRLPRRRQAGSAAAPPAPDASQTPAPPATAEKAESSKSPSSSAPGAV
jgi:leucyl/phenylalanyl-tRNA--protein transferase